MSLRLSAYPLVLLFNLMVMFISYKDSQGSTSEVETVNVASDSKEELSIFNKLSYGILVIITETNLPFFMNSEFKKILHQGDEFSEKTFMDRKRFSNI